MLQDVVPPLHAHGELQLPPGRRVTAAHPRRPPPLEKILELKAQPPPPLRCLHELILRQQHLGAPQANERVPGVPEVAAVAAQPLEHVVRRRVPHGQPVDERAAGATKEERLLQRRNEQLLVNHVQRRRERHLRALALLRPTQERELLEPGELTTEPLLQLQPLAEPEPPHLRPQKVTQSQLVLYSLVFLGIPPSQSQVLRQSPPFRSGGHSREGHGGRLSLSSS